MGLQAKGRLNTGQWGYVAIFAAALLALSFVFGGASRQNALRLAVVELAALPLIVLTIRHLLNEAVFARRSFCLAILALTVLLPLSQVIPLPPGLWQALPGRDDLTLGLALTGTPPGWTPLSLTPDLTWRSVLALFPPIAMLLGVLVMPAIFRQRVIWLWLALTVAGITLAAAQIASGGDRLYPWSWTQPGFAVGFFANRNHMAALCTTAIPFAVALATADLGNRIWNRRALWIGIGLTLLLVAAIATIRSRAGIVLAAPAVLVSLLAAWRMSGRWRPDRRLLMIGGAVVLATVMATTFALAPIIARFESMPLSQEGRFAQWPLVIEAAQLYLPVGSGIGSFDAVFRSIEPLAALDSTYFNAAHNEYLQIWLEAGWLGVALLIAFAVWYGRRSWSAWRGGASQDRNLQRAASIAIGLLLAHSFVDYPLRTETMAVFFALCCGILEFAGRPRGETRQPA